MDEGDNTHRTRILTVKGQELYEDRLFKLRDAYNNIWRQIDERIYTFDSEDSNIKYLRETDDQVNKMYKDLLASSNAIMSYLDQQHTEPAIQEMNIHVTQYGRRIELVKKFRNQLDSMMLSAAEAHSVKLESRSNAASQAPSFKVQKQLERSAKKAQLECLDKEIELQKQRAVADIELKALEQRKISAVADAEARVIESFEPLLEDLAGDVRSQKSLRQVKKERVAEFVTNSQSVPTPRDELLIRSSERPRLHVPDNDLSVSIPSVNIPPVRPPDMEVNQQANYSVARELSTYLLKKDLLMVRFTTFKDSAQHYSVWKASFQSIIKELDASPLEELDLLTKWLGPDSKEFAVSMRAVNISEPKRALRLIWTRLEQMYGRAETRERELSEKVVAFPVLTDSHADRIKYLRLMDLLSEIESAMSDERCANLLSYYNSSKGVLPITQKLPKYISERWAVRASQYKTQHGVTYPPFSFFVQYIREVSERKNDPSFYSMDSEAKAIVRTESRQRQTRNIDVRKASLTGKDVKQAGSDCSESNLKRCPIHNAAHSLTTCRSFLAMTLNQRRDFLKNNNLCFKCCIGKHRAQKCQSVVKCEKCSSDRHVTCMHYDQEPKPQHGGESVVPKFDNNPDQPISSKCSELCGNTVGGRSCGKVMLVDVYHNKQPERVVRMYAIVDDQSNKTLARSKFFDLFDVSCETSVFTMSSCSGSVSYSGRSAENFTIKSALGEAQLCLPEIIECDDIPNNLTEIPTPDVALAYPHLSDVAPCIPVLDPSLEILLLIGRDIPRAHHVFEQKTGYGNEPFAQRLYLGWTIIGEVCLGGMHKPNQLSALKTHVLGNGRTSMCKPCDGQFTVSEGKLVDPTFSINSTEPNQACSCCDIFSTTRYDETPGLSFEDRQFMSLMQEEMKKNEDGMWISPLPFRDNRARLPNNRSQALRRAVVLDNGFKRDHTRRDHAIEFMDKVFRNGHAEPAPPLQPGQECWYLPIFSVYHPQKPNKVRMVFDSSAKYLNMSLNSVLLSGPNLTNSLIGVLMKFRLHQVAITADIEQMFYCFRVAESHRDFLRFLWYADNNPANSLVDYRMCAHVFGNTPSPAIASYGLKRSAVEAEKTYGQDVREFIDNNFYVDDGLISLPSTGEAIDLLKRTREALLTHGRLRLHKIASNDPAVMQAFEPQDLAKDLINFDFGLEDLPIQRSLGLIWDLQKDSFRFRLTTENKPFTRRGVLSHINSLYDPLGFVAPVIVQGKIILRDIFETSINWDDPLPEVFLMRWASWREALSRLQSLEIPRQYFPSLKPTSKTVAVFTDASESAIAAVAYLRDQDLDRKIHLGFIMGKAKVAPRKATSIPRLELCAAVLGVEIARKIRDQLGISVEDISFYTDSMIVLGYIYNKTRRFLTYVSNRVQRILSFSSSEQWRFVPTDVNPADHGTKPAPGYTLNYEWLHGPTEWLSECTNTPAGMEPPEFGLVDPETDVEIKKEVVVNKTSTTVSFTTKRYENFSTWQSLIRALVFLKIKCKSVKDPECDPKLLRVTLFSETENFVIRTVQNELFRREIKCLKEGKPLPKDSRILQLDPRLDKNDIIRVGGRIKHADISLQEKNPIIVPGFHHIARLIVLHQHDLVRHQGRYFTEGAIRAAGLWITGCKRLVYSVISNCVKCRRSRGKLSTQKMCDLPAERITPSPPFTYVGVDCFGPWEVVTRRTRGGSANSKRWAVLFTCMCSRAVNIEVLEEMSTPSFVNALRRFYSIRGKVKEFFSDRGSNFIGCVRELAITGINVEDPQIQSYFQKNGTVWNFNTPYSSHMGGAWERLVGVTRRILDSLLFDVRHTKLTHEVLTTFLAEVSAIINNRPLTPVSTDPNAPFILTPNILLTQKTGDVSESHMDVNVRSFYASQWKVVQALADRFWSRWRSEYLQTLQQRKKWEGQIPNLNVGDVVLMKDSDVHRNNWPLGRISRVFPSKDDLVRKVELFVIVDGIKRFYVRPITQIVP